MRPTTTALRQGLARGRIELRQSFAGVGLLGHLFWPVVTLVAIAFLRDRSFQASGFTLGALALPSVLGMFVALGMLLTVQYLTAEREDGTLLRAKAIPNGIGGYFVGKLVTVSGTILVYLTVLPVPGLLLVDGLEVGGIGSWLTLAWVLLLGLVATQSIGAMLGALISSSRGASYLSLPDAAASVELGGSWRHLETIGVLGAWAVLGLVVAPIVLRRMARRESGSRVAERRQQLLQRIG
jgi:ABC-2 type transport system permease protein